MRNKQTQREIKNQQTVAEVIKLIKKKMKGSKYRSSSVPEKQNKVRKRSKEKQKKKLSKEKKSISDLRPSSPAHADYVEYSFVPDSVPMKKKRKDFWAKLSSIKPNLKPSPQKMSTTVKDREGK